jgi:hypothetical protein
MTACQVRNADIRHAIGYANSDRDYTDHVHHVLPADGAGIEVAAGSLRALIVFIASLAARTGHRIEDMAEGVHNDHLPGWYFFPAVRITAQ